MALLNVRLSPEDARQAAALRRAGIEISTVVRDAIHAEYDRRIAPRAAKKRPSRILAEILAELPDPAGLEARPFAITDRAAVQKHVARELGRRRK